MGRYDQFDQPNRINPLRILLIILLISLVLGIGYLIYPNDDEKTIDKGTSERREVPLKIPIKNSPGGGSTTTTKTNQHSPPESISKLTSAIASQPNRLVAPSLEQSDTAIQQDIDQLAPSSAKWFTEKQLISKYLTIVNDFSQGLRPYKHFRFLKLQQPFTVQRDDLGIAIDPNSYQRYDVLVSAIDQLDIDLSLNYYRIYRPLLNQVFDSFGYPESHNIDDIFKLAIAQILEAPIVEQRINLISHATRYKFADKKLESLNPAQKQIIRMGPENTRKLQNKLRQFIQALTLDS